MVTVENGHATIPVNTTGYESGRYKVMVEYLGGERYNDTISANSILTLNEPWTEIGYGTDTPWDSSMMQGGSINSGKIFVDVYNTPMILNSIAFSSDFEIEMQIGMSNVGGRNSFGFTKSPTTIQQELVIYNKYMDNWEDEDNTTNFPSLFTVANQTETIRLKREGNTYTLTHRGQSYNITVQNAQPVYLYIQRMGTDSTYLEKIKYNGGGELAKLLMAPPHRMVVA